MRVMEFRLGKMRSWLAFILAILFFYLGIIFLPGSVSVPTQAKPFLDLADQDEMLLPEVSIGPDGIQSVSVGQSAAVPEAIPMVEKPTLVQGLIVKEYTVKKGDSLYIALSGMGIEDQEIFEIARVSKPVYNLKKIRPGQKIHLTLHPGSNRIDTLIYEIDRSRRLKVERLEDRLTALKEEVDLDREVAFRTGTIIESLYESGRRSGVPIEVILDLSDIFAWDLDFGIDIRSGDQFSVVFEIYKRAGQTVRTGRILAAKIINRGKTYPAYYFAPEGGRGDYFDANGRSLRKAFLKSPLRYRYISSGYTRRRLHPILKVNRPHLGIDFAARQGTPVRAAADGIVTFAGWKGGHGKTVIIRHKNGYKTLYGHLSSFWRGIKKGKRVYQEDFIGKVGSTGLSTGPHLHYTLMKNGRAINPRKAEILRGNPLPKKWHTVFLEQLERMNRLLGTASERDAENNAA